MRRPTTVEWMLLTTIVLWALNLTVSRYILVHGFQPLAYGSVRYGLAALVFASLTLAVERSLRISRRHLPLIVAAAAVLYVNQIAFVYALRSTTASVLALILGATPIFAACAGLALRTERLSSRFWAAALLRSAASRSSRSAPGASCPATSAACCSGSSRRRPGRPTRCS